MPLSPQPLREQVKEGIRHDVLEGHLEPGLQVRIAPLAERFAVSPTPAREALTQLEAEGWLELRPNRGFFVAPLDLGEAKEIYPLLWTLEATALDAGRPTESDLRELQRINELLEGAGERVAEAYECDRRWHDLLVARCPNRLLLRHLGSVRSRAERYERAYMRHAGLLPTSVKDHEAIIAALAAGSEALLPLVRDHWQLSLTFLEGWLGDRSPSP